MTTGLYGAFSERSGWGGANTDSCTKFVQLYKDHGSPFEGSSQVCSKTIYSVLLILARILHPDLNP